LCARVEIERRASGRTYRYLVISGGVLIDVSIAHAAPLNIAVALALELVVDMDIFDVVVDVVGEKLISRCRDIGPSHPVIGTALRIWHIV
jgi:hypothetical protein